MDGVGSAGVDGLGLGPPLELSTSPEEVVWATIGAIVGGRRSAGGVENSGVGDLVKLSENSFSWVRETVLGVELVGTGGLAEVDG